MITLGSKAAWCGMGHSMKWFGRRYYLSQLFRGNENKKTSDIAFQYLGLKNLTHTICRFPPSRVVSNPPARPGLKKKWTERHGGNKLCWNPPEISQLINSKLRRTVFVAFCPRRKDIARNGTMKWHDIALHIIEKYKNCKKLQKSCGE